MAALVAVAVSCTSAVAFAADWQSTAISLPASALDRLVPAAADANFVDSNFVRSSDAGGELVAWPRGKNDWRTSSILRISKDRRVGTEHALPHVVEAAATNRTGRGVVLSTGDLLGVTDEYRKAPGLWATATAPDGTPGKPQRLSDNDIRWPDPQVAINARGDAVAVWIEDWSIRVRAAVRPAGKRFGRPVTLATADANSPQLGWFSPAISSNGRVIVAYGTNVKGSYGQALSWVGSANGGFGPRLELGRMTVTGSEEENGAIISAAFDGRGRGFVAWGGPKRQSPTSVASIARGAARFTKAVTLDAGSRKDGTEWFSPLTALAASPQGGAVFTWTSPRGGTRAASFDASGALARTVRLPGASGTNAAVRGTRRVAFVTAQRGKDAGQLWLASSGRLRLRAVGQLPVLPFDQRRYYDVDPSDRMRITTFGLDASGEPELRAVTRMD